MIRFRNRWIILGGTGPPGTLADAQLNVPRGPFLLGPTFIGLIKHWKIYPRWPGAVAPFSSRTFFPITFPSYDTSRLKKYALAYLCRLKTHLNKWRYKMALDPNHDYSQADLDNHADQLNPDAEAYWESRGEEMPDRPFFHTGRFKNL